MMESETKAPSLPTRVVNRHIGKKHFQEEPEHHVVVVFPGKKVGGKCDEEIERQEQAENAKEFGNPFAVEIHA